MHKVAVVILNYNGKDFLQQFLPAVIENNSDCEIIVGDNGSTDDSIEYLEKIFPEVQIIKLPVNEGFSKGYNLVLQQVQAEYYVLLNSDVEVTKDWIDPVIALMDHDPSIAACQPKILSYYNKDTFEHAGAAGGFIDKLGYPFCRGRIFDTVEKDQGQYDDEIQIFWATGACLFIRAALFHKMGGFDDHFFAHMEEIDLCWRLNKAGYKIMYQGKSKVYHIGGGTLPKTNSRKTFLNFRNSLLMLHKNLSPPERKKIIRLRILSDAIAALRFFITGQWSNGQAVIKAYIYYFKNAWNLYDSINKSSPVHQINEMPIYNGLIVVSYFFKNKKIYSAL
ncbi:MAG: glycosyltransferase family 2 protein [Bacteroidota bacterium]|nr:glycosyltransferase family 2 protein [Bacteroidota bacterium]